MTKEETIGAVIMALDLYRISLAKQYTKIDTSKYAGLIEHGELLIEGLQDVISLLKKEREKLA